MNWRINGIIGVTLVLISGIYLQAFPASAASFELVSISIEGEAGNFPSFYGDLSEDGRYIAFMSFANNLIERDRNREADIFLRDLVSGTTTLVSQSPDVNGASDESYSPSISGDGRFVVFVSPSRNLVTNDTNRLSDVFVFDRDTQEIKRISLSNAGQEADGKSYEPSISSDGTTIVFFSDASNLESNGEDGNTFIYDMIKGKITGLGITGFCRNCNNIISNDGRFIIFVSEETWLIDGLTSNNGDIFRYDQHTKQVELVSITIKGKITNNYSDRPYLSEDGKFVSFSSEAPNLVDHDENFDQENIFLRDLSKDNIILVSVNDLNQQITTSIYPSAVSNDGGFVAFSQEEKIYVYDAISKKSQKFDVDGVVTSISGNGRFVAFYTRDSLVPEDTDDDIDVYTLELFSSEKLQTTITDEAKIVPDWIKINAGWWATRQIDDNSFVQGIQWLIANDFIKIYESRSENLMSQEIPEWIKNNAGWWATGQIDDNSFIQGIQWLIKNGIITV